MPVVCSQRPNTLARCTSGSGQVGERAAAGVPRSTRIARRGAGGVVGVLRDAGLDGGLLVGGDHELVRPQRRVVEAAGVEVEDMAALDLEVGVAGDSRTDAATVHRIRTQPCQTVVPEIEATMPGLTAARARSGDCQRASGVSVFAGSSQASALIATTTSREMVVLSRRSVKPTRRSSKKRLRHWTTPPVVCRVVLRSRRCPDPRPWTERSGAAQHRNTVTYICVRGLRVLRARHRQETL